MITRQTLIDDLASGCKSKDQFRVGLEVEQFAYNVKTNQPLAYDGNPGILQLLQAFAEAYGWEEITENNKVIALKDSNSNFITLEPGGQVEYSGAPMKNVHDAQIAMDTFYTQLHKIAQSLDIGFLAKGFHPSWKLDEIHQMPKRRAQIMDAYMERIQSMGKNLMYRACTAQINLDHASEEDMVKNLRLSIAVQPAIVALMANSTEAEGKDTGYQSYRSHMWNNTDADRCGILPFAFEEGMGFARYVDYALDVPMYYICRDGDYIDVAGLSFRDFMAGKLQGFEGEYPTLQDWREHLSTLFPEVRLKHYLELRGADCHTPEMVYAMAAFWTGLFYNETARDAAWDLVKNWTIEDHQTIRNIVPKQGLNTPTPDGRTLSALAIDVLALLNDDYLEPYKKILAS